MVDVIQETKDTKLHDSDAHKHPNLVSMKYVLVFARLQYFAHATTPVYVYAHMMYIYTYIE